MSWNPPPVRIAARALAVVALAAPQLRAGETDAPRVPILSHADLTRELEHVARDADGAASIVPIGSSRGGRRIDALRLARGPLAPGRPAILVVGALDVEFAWTSGLVLEHARALVARSGTDDALRALLETTTLYLVPCANPDAAERRTSTPIAEIAATGPGADDDRDGRDGEDGPADVDGDGVIGWMRVLDPKGRWIEDPAEPRALVEADASKGQRGRWRLIREARDADGDGEAGEDPSLDVIVNQNFPQGWIEHARESGRYATAEPEARALADFLVSRPEIALVLTYGLLDNLAVKPKTREDTPRRSASPADGIPSADGNLLAEIGRRWKELGGKSGPGAARDAGTFQAWVQAQRGLWTVNLNPWSVPLDEKAPTKPGPDAAGAAPDEAAGVATPEGPQFDAARPAEKKRAAPKSDEPKPSDDAQRLRWFDARPELGGFRPWTRIEHPDFAHAEVGGFAPFALHEPPPDERAEIAERTLALLVELGALLPRVTIAAARAISLGADTWRIEAVVENGGLLSYPSALGRRARNVRPARVQLELAEGAALLAGPRQELVLDLAGSGGRREIAWIVRAGSIDAVTILLDTDQAGSARARPQVKP